MCVVEGFTLLQSEVFVIFWMFHWYYLVGICCCIFLVCELFPTIAWISHFFARNSILIRQLLSNILTVIVSKISIWSLENFIQKYKSNNVVNSFEHIYKLSFGALDQISLNHLSLQIDRFNVIQSSVRYKDQLTKLFTAFQNWHIFNQPWNWYQLHRIWHELKTPTI